METGGGDLFRASAHRGPLTRLSGTEWHQSCAQLIHYEVRQLLSMQGHRHIEREMEIRKEKRAMNLLF